MAENLNLACYLLFCGCILAALLNVYWQELIRFPHFAYDCIRGWFRIDTPAEREWSLIKASVISALLIAGYLWWLSTHSAFVSQFPGTLVITVIAIPVAWILWVWRNQDKRETLNNEKVKIEQTEKELGWKEDDRLWNNFFERQKIADDKSVPENVRITALYALESYLKLDEKTRFPELAKDFLFNILQDVQRNYQRHLNRFLWGMMRFDTDVFNATETKQAQIAKKFLYPIKFDSAIYCDDERFLFPGMSVDCIEFTIFSSSSWLPYSHYSCVKFYGIFHDVDFFKSNFINCTFVSRFESGNFIDARLNSITANDVAFAYCNFFHTIWQGGSRFEKCSFQCTLFVGNSRVSSHEAIYFKENQFNNCCFINSQDLLTEIVGQNSNSYLGIKILQFPFEFICAYEREMKEKKWDFHATMYQQVWVHYLFSPHAKMITIPDSGIDLYLEYKTQKDEYEKSLDSDSSDFLVRLMANIRDKDIFGELFQYERNELPYLNELLDMAYCFEKTKKLDWQTLNCAYDAKKAELEAEFASVTD